MQYADRYAWSMTNTLPKTFTLADLSTFTESDERASGLEEGQVYCEYGFDIDESVFITHIDHHGDTILITGVDAIDGTEVETTLDIDEAVCLLTPAATN